MTTPFRVAATFLAGPVIGISVVELDRLNPLPTLAFVAIIAAASLFATWLIWETRP